MKIDKFIVKYIIDSSDVTKKSKELMKQFDDLEKKANQTAKAVSNAFKPVVDSLGKVEKAHKAQSKQAESAKKALDTVAKSSKKKPKDKESTQDKLINGKAEKNIKKANEGLEKTSKLFKSLSGGADGLIGAISDLVPALAPLAVFGAIYKTGKFVNDMAAQVTPTFFNAQRFNTPISELSNLQRAAGFVGAKGSDINQALGTISMAETETRLIGNSPLNKILQVLQVPLSENNQARGPADILNNIANALQRDIKSGRISKQDAYNLLAMAGFSEGAQNFMMQPEAVREKEMNSQKGNDLTKAQVQALKNLTMATANLKNSFNELEINVAAKLAPALSDMENFLASIIQNPTLKNFNKNFKKNYPILSAPYKKMINDLNPFPASKDTTVKEKALNSVLFSFGLSATKDLTSQYNTAVNNQKTQIQNHSTTHATIGDIHVHTQATDAKGISQDIKSHLNYSLISQANTGIF